MSDIKITVILATCDRYETTLPLCLLSIINQTRKPNKLILIDDNKVKKFYDYEIFRHILSLLKLNLIEFEYVCGDGKGLVPALKIGFNRIENGWVLKTDDDNVLSENAIELFEKNITEDVGAMSGIIIDKESINRSDEYLTKPFNKIENIYCEFNIQMVGNQSDDIKFVEHLYSNYFFRLDLAEPHPENLYPSSHREETIFTHEIFRKGYKLLVIPQVKIFHLNINKEDGNRKYSVYKNEIIFLDRLKEWGVIPNKIQIKEYPDILYHEKNGQKFLVVNKVIDTY